MGSCAAPSAKGDDKFITTDYLQQCPARNSASSASLSTDMSVPKASSETMESMFSDLRSNSFLFAG
ncbi:hypothetical protein C2L73_25400 [Klebsiella pneumoniae]|nr:hypothetical protein CLQ46_27425 [Klebsiella pneumoniae subsp. pneumoniae]AXK99211.1 hypothetical protein C2L60_25425 [Klebsiella pneumoniae]PCE99454.1 hypothetical protein CE183_20830 [Klebsiella pneumoniae]PCF04741.1 hypothetical protein CE181_22190 [Klebsiella pneumoniae]PKS62265.1 hypothetical protein CYD92_21330 [Klebsiella pneumoniae]